MNECACREKRRQNDAYAAVKMQYRTKTDSRGRSIKKEKENDTEINP